MKLQFIFLNRPSCGNCVHWKITPDAPHSEIVTWGTCAIYSNRSWTSEFHLNGFACKRFKSREIKL